METRVTYAVFRGKNKFQCEDTALIGKKVLSDSSGEVVLTLPTWICLCDGVGGNAGGQEASSFVCNFLCNRDLPSSQEEYVALFSDCNKALLKRAATTPGYKKMATTATCLAFSDNKVLLGYIGNTRLYAFRGGYLTQITEDQTTYQWLINAGAHDAADICNRSEILGALGGGNERFAELTVFKTIYEGRIPPILILTSDGVHEYVDEDTMERILSSEDISPLKKVDTLCKIALDNGSLDDRSAIMVVSYAIEHTFSEE